MSCKFFDPNAEQLSTLGCEAVAITTDGNGPNLVCGCTHMTDFGAFLTQGVEVITGSNFDVWGALTSLTLTKLFSNIGAYIGVGYWGAFIVFGLICLTVDRIKLKNNFNSALFLSIGAGSNYRIPLSESSVSIH